MLKLSTKVNQVFWGKNLENENFMAAAIHCENWYFKKKTNIFHYFPSKNLKYSQIFLSETIHAQENGSRGPHFAKSLNSNFLKGLTYSAMLVQKYFEAKFCYSREGSWRIFFGRIRQKINLGHRWYIISEIVGKLSLRKQINKDNVCRIGKYEMRRFLVVHMWNQSSSNTHTSHYLNSLMLFGGE